MRHPSIGELGTKPGDQLECRGVTGQSLARRKAAAYFVTDERLSK